jgi:hypothetical protein
MGYIRPIYSLFVNLVSLAQIHSQLMPTNGYLLQPLLQRKQLFSLNVVSLLMRSAFRLLLFLTTFVCGIILGSDHAAARRHDANLVMFLSLTVSFSQLIIRKQFY